MPSTTPKPYLATLIATVAELWPAVFTADGWREHKALALGIDEQLIQSGALKPYEAAALLRSYTRRRMYQAALAAGGYRHNLDGSISGEIAAEHVVAAKASLAAMDERAAKSAATAKAARQATRKTAERPKGPAPYHKPRPEIARPAPPLRAGDGLAALRAAARARRQAAEAQP
jgi:sRNA-binding protein